MTACNIDESAGTIADLAAAHARAARAAALVLRTRIDQHTQQRGQEPRRLLYRHVLNINSSAGQLAAQLGALQGEVPPDVPSRAEIRGELIYLGTAVVQLLEELERRWGQPELDPAAPIEQLRREAVALRLVHDPDPAVARMSALESLAQDTLERERHDRGWYRDPDAEPAVTWMPPGASA